MAGVSGMSALQVQPFGGLAPFDFDPGAVVWSDDMAKRASTVFATAPIIQGHFDNSGTPDLLSFVQGAQIHGDFYANFDGNQSGIVCWYTPEIANADRATGSSHIYYLDANNYLLYDWDNSRFEASIDGSTITQAQALVAGTLYNLSVRWQMSGPIDGTNFGAVGVNDTYTYGVTTAPSVTPTATVYVGSTNTPTLSADGIVEGFDIRRVPWFDGLYGVSMIYTSAGPLDELNDIYAAAAGRDSALTNNGAWDFNLFVPTDATAGALVTGTGEAWSFPSASNVIPHGWAEDGFYGGGDWAVLGNGTNTNTDCGSAAALDDMPNGANGWTWDGWVRVDGTDLQYITYKGTIDTNGWFVRVNASGQLEAEVECATDAVSVSSTLTDDTQWHHCAASYRHTGAGGDGNIYFAIDGAWESTYTTQTASVGAFVADAALNQMFGHASSALDGCWGWQRFSDINTRFTVGTDFIAPRAFPAADGNTIEAWSFNDGTGVNIVAQVASPGNDGTLANGTWEEQWNQLNSPVEFHGVEYNATTTSGVITDAARIQDLHDAAMTAEAWVRADGWGEANTGAIWDKSDNVSEGWNLRLDSTHGLRAYVYAADTNAQSRSGADDFVPDGKLHLVTMQYDDGGDRKIYLWVDGIPVSYSQQVAAVGLVVSDIGNNLYQGNVNAGTRTFDGNIGGWARVSSVLRYTNGEAFVPDDPFNPPGTDANTAWQTDFSDGAGATLTDDSAGANNCTLSNYVWLNSFDMNDISPGSRIYGGQGYIVGSNGANDGTIVTFTGLTPGDDYYLHSVGHPGPDSRGDLNLLVYDETNAANITSFNLCRYTGTHTGGAGSATLVAPAGSFSQRQVGGICWNIDDGSFGTITGVSGDGTTITAPLGGGGSNDWQNGEVYRITWTQTGSVGNVCDRYPNVEEFGFELPALCTSISVRVQETSGEGAWWLHQVSLLTDLWDDPSSETGTAPTDVGTPTTSAQSAIQAHSETNSWRVITDAVDEGIERAITVVDGDYYHVSGWVFADTANTVDMQVTGGEYQDGTTTTRVTTVNDIWEKLGGVVRATSVTLRLRFLSNVAVQEFFVDDVAVF